jgi:hypothetical protein
MTTAERVARNNMTFREANEQIRAKADEYGPPMERLPFLCECAEESCTQIVSLTPDEYSRIRAEPIHFLNAVGHDSAGGPHVRVVDRRDRYVVVEKIGAARGVVEAQTDR